MLYPHFALVIGLSAMTPTTLLVQSPQGRSASAQAHSDSAPERTARIADRSQLLEISSVKNFSEEQRNTLKRVEGDVIAFRDALVLINRESEKEIKGRGEVVRKRIDQIKAGQPEQPQLWDEQAKKKALPLYKKHRALVMEAMMRYIAADSLQNWKPGMTAADAAKEFKRRNN